MAVAGVEAVETDKAMCCFVVPIKVGLDFAEAMTCSARQVADEMVVTQRGWFDESGTLELTDRSVFQKLSSKPTIPWIFRFRVAVRFRTSVRR
jgi:hypothetical protein